MVGLGLKRRLLSKPLSSQVILGSLRRPRDSLTQSAQFILEYAVHASEAGQA